MTELNFGHIQPLMFVVVIDFRSSSIIHVCRCDLFGHVQIFRSYSFGHVESVKWLFLFLTYLKKIKNFIIPIYSTVHTHQPIYQKFCSYTFRYFDQNLKLPKSWWIQDSEKVKSWKQGSAKNSTPPGYSKIFADSSIIQGQIPSQVSPASLPWERFKSL